MELAAAWVTLGMEPSNDAARIRAAYVRRLFELHPDVNPGRDAAAETARLIAAFEVVNASLEDPAPPPRPATAVGFIDDTTIGVDAPGPETFGLVLDAAHRLGEVTYLDPGAGLIQVMVEFVDGPLCQVVFTTQGRATGVTEVFSSIESIGTLPAPDLADVVALFAQTMGA